MKLDSLDAVHRLNELKYTENGWMEDGSGIAPDKDALKRLSRLFDENYPSDAVQPYIYPTPSGNIEMEWTIGRRGFLLKVDLSTLMAEMTDTGREDITEFDLSSAHGWTLLNDLLKRAATNETVQGCMILEDMSMDALDRDTVARYRMQFSNFKPGHVWEKIFVDDFLSKIGAVRRSDNDGMLHPTAAGLLMFGRDTEIVNEFPNYFLDYREAFGEDADERWRDRVTSGTGDWSGNLYDFYYRIRDRLTSDLKVPFMLLNGKDRIDETKMHKALHEALANALIHSDYYERRGVVIDKKKTGVVISNPGALRISKDEALNGGVSDPRNGALFLMFSLIGIGERAGSGLMNIEMVWKEKGLPRPILTERFNPDRTTLILPFGKENGNLDTISVRLSEDQARAIELLKNGPLSAAELMSGMSYAFTQKAFYKSILLPLKEAGYIGLTIPDRPNSKNQKYCILSISNGSG